MGQRFVAVYFPQLLAEGKMRRQPRLKTQPFVMTVADHGRLRISAMSPGLSAAGIYRGMVLADARALVAGLESFEQPPTMALQLLRGLGNWAHLFTPLVALDHPDGLILDASGCAHLWGGESDYLQAIYRKLENFGYTARLAMADTMSAAWAMARYDSPNLKITDPGMHRTGLQHLRPAALGLSGSLTARLEKLGLKTLGDFMFMQRSVLRRRFGPEILEKLDQFLGLAVTPFVPLQPVVPYLIQLPCPEPVTTRKGIEMALKQLLEGMNRRLSSEDRGARQLLFRARRIDNDLQEIKIGTHWPSRDPQHLFKLFETHIGRLQPGLGFELFILSAQVTEKLQSGQEKLWHQGRISRQQLAGLLDRLTTKLGEGKVHRYLPAAHYLPELSYRKATGLEEVPAVAWVQRPRPVRLLLRPEPIQVTAPIPDYPPMQFRYKGQLYDIRNAEGPERIEAAWWLAPGPHRDYYIVEDQTGARYWLYRLGHYNRPRARQWFLHGFFA
ncbi:DNA polymerase Y family protein [Niabella terrae]